MRVYVQSIYLVGGGLIIEANIPVQELEGLRGEGAYFREDTVIGVHSTMHLMHPDYWQITIMRDHYHNTHPI